MPALDLTQSIQFETILNLILTGWLPDPTQGALFFQNTRIVAARAATGVVSPHLVDFGGTRRSQKFAIIASTTHAQRPT